VLVLGTAAPTMTRTPLNFSPHSRRRVSLAWAHRDYMIKFVRVGPFVTAVGATTGISRERAARFSGGGFSNYFSTPSYQADATAAFLTTLGSTYSGLYK